jgi:hypothetical protein
VISFYLSFRRLFFLQDQIDFIRLIHYFPLASIPILQSQSNHPYTNMSSKPGANKSKPAGKNQGRGNKKPFVNPHRLANGSKGFLFSHTLNRDKESKREAYNLLKNYADIMYGPEPEATNKADDVEEEMDIEDALKAEINTIKSKKARRFTALQEFGCTLFVGCDASIDPTALTEFIVENQRGETKHKVSLYHILRIEPVQDTCYVVFRFCRYALGCREDWGYGVKSMWIFV